MENKIIMKGLKSYLTGKKYYETHTDKSFEYFKQCITILNDIKEHNIKVNDSLSNLLEETETECQKYIIQTEKPKNNLNENIFEIIEKGEIFKIKDYSKINYKVYNNNGLTPLHYAIKLGDSTFIKKALMAGVNIDLTNKLGNTLLEYACQEGDINMISFLFEYGADMKKHLFFRDGKKYDNSGDEIDILCLEKIVMETECKYKNIKYLDFIFNFFKKNDNIELKFLIKMEDNTTRKIKILQFILYLDNLIDTFNNDSRETYINILKEELEYDLEKNICCPNNKFHIILYAIVPFINYENLKLRWLCTREINLLLKSNLDHDIILKSFKNYESLIEKEFINIIVTNIK